jgi:midasin
VSNIEIVEACLRFLKLDLSFFRRAWNWDEFIELYHNRGCDLQKLFCNQIIALLFGMTSTQLSSLNANLPKEVAIEAEARKSIKDIEMSQETDEADGLEWTFKSNVITEVEGVFLPIYDKSNFEFYNENLDKFDKIIRVDSTKINLRSLALGVSSGKAICLSGPVGCGKTSLVEHLARKTGRIAPKINDFMQFMQTKQQKKEIKVVKGNKRKLRQIEEDFVEIQENICKTAPKNGFLRIQLGDQTDSKVLLGQYRCTDVPGEFLWQPGVLTQAVLNGYWLLLEDLDSATQDVCTVLTNLLENDFLNVPGFRENLKIAPGFQLFVTLR